MMFLYCLLWNCFIWGGTAYLIQVYEWSLWWFVLTFVLTAFPGEYDNPYDSDDDEDEPRPPLGGPPVAPA